MKYETIAEFALKCTLMSFTCIDFFLLLNSFQNQITQIHMPYKVRQLASYDLFRSNLITLRSINDLHYFDRFLSTS